MTSSDEMIEILDTSQTVSILPDICNSVYDPSVQFYHLKKRCEKLEAQLNYYKKYKKYHNKWRQRGYR